VHSRSSPVATGAIRFEANFDATTCGGGGGDDDDDDNDDDDNDDAMTMPMMLTAMTTAFDVPCKL